MPSAIIHIPTDARREARAVLGRSTADSMLKKFHRMLKSKTDGRYDGTFKGFFNFVAGQAKFMIRYYRPDYSNPHGNNKIPVGCEMYDYDPDSGKLIRKEESGAHG